MIIITINLVFWQAKRPEIQPMDFPYHILNLVIKHGRITYCNQFLSTSESDGYQNFIYSFKACAKVLNLVSKRYGELYFLKVEICSRAKNTDKTQFSNFEKVFCVLTNLKKWNRFVFYKWGSSTEALNLALNLRCSFSTNLTVLVHVPGILNF